MTSFGEKLLALRNERGWSQQELADQLKACYPHLHVSQTTLAAWEKRSDVPRGAVLMALAEFFTLSQAYFMPDGYSRQTLNRRLKRVRALMDELYAELDALEDDYAVATRNLITLLGQDSADDDTLKGKE